MVDEIELLKAKYEMLMFYVDWMLNHGTFDRQLTANELIDLTNRINEQYPGVKGKLPSRVKDILSGNNH